MRQLILLATTLSLFAPVAFAEELYPGYAWQVLGDDIYLHTRTDPLAGPIDGNSTVIVNDEDVFVVDTHINPAAARGSRSAARDPDWRRVPTRGWHCAHGAAWR